jgi:glutamate-1-semialdehyde 2,1-aminomutase
MKRFRDDRPADICFARGTFNAHPYVMGAMQVFLERMETPAVRDLYVGLDEIWNARAARSTRAGRRRPAGAGGQSVQYLDGVLHPPSRYNWMLQYYLRAEGLALSWVGTGR